MGYENKIIIEILKNFSFQNKLLIDNEYALFYLNNNISNAKRRIFNIENKINDIYEKVNEISLINNTILTIFVFLQIIILFKIF